MRFPTFYRPFFLVMGDRPDMYFPSGRYGRPGRGSPVCVGEKLGDSSPTYDQALSVHPIPFYFRNLIQKFYPFNHGLFQGISVRESEGS